MVIARVLVNKKHETKTASDLESEYNSDHSYEFQMGPIDYAWKPPKAPKYPLKQVILIQSLIRGFLIRAANKKRQRNVK